MPQLDLMHFFSQFFWFSIMFIILFFYLNLTILPILVKNLKYRSKKLIVLSKKINDTKQDVVELCSFHDNLISNSFKTINKKVLDSTSLSRTSLTKRLNVLSSDLCYDCNKSYFTFVNISTYKNFVFSKHIF
uniref:ATP synthase F0 subunit 8 n=1 Tax=Storeatula sp. CCMP1868 TaxID=195070 RepID=A0A2P1G8A7_9CRYP|nr:ATP synthase F0 subunit 8 [Storeatula sp. CCMP1868]AVM81173.1 ATP synthase F0 subunit 8 [Storeatula sp. CCMP1868]